MQSAIGAGAFALLMIGSISGSHAGPEQLAFPTDYENSFIRFKALDKRDQDPDVVRALYVDPQTASRVRPGEPLPEGTQLLLVDQFAAVADDGQTLLDRDGRMVPTGEVKQILMAEKRTGFGAEHGELRTGDWEFAAFLSDGSRKPDVNFDKCRKCHLQAERFDFTFSVFPNLDAIKR